MSEMALPASGARMRRWRGIKTRLRLHGMPATTLAVTAAAVAAPAPAQAIAPIVQIGKLTPSDGAAEDQFGRSVAVSADGSTIVVGAHTKGMGIGAVYVFVRPVGEFANATQTAKLTSPDAGKNNFGSSVAVSADGSTIAVGGSNYSANVDGEGAVYVFTRPGGGWVDSSSATARLLPSNSVHVGNTALGTAVSVAADGDTIAAGASGDASFKGAVYVFAKPGGGWVDGEATAKLTAGDGKASDFLAGLGRMAISGDGQTIVASAPNHDTEGENNFGSVYLWEKPGASWASATQDAAIPACDPNVCSGVDKFFGNSVAISGDGATIAAGWRGFATGSGRVFVFERPGGGWEDAYSTGKPGLRESEPAAGDFLGASSAVSSDGSTIAAGLPFANGGGADRGAIDVFAKPGGGWVEATEDAHLTATDAADGDSLGTSVATNSDGSLIVGGDDISRNAVYVFAPSSTVHATETAVSCAPHIVVVDTGSTVCTATVTDTSGTPTAPTGTVDFQRSGISSGDSSTFSAPSCALGSPTADSSSCSVVFNPKGGGLSIPRFDTIGVDYGGDATHQGGDNTDLVDVEGKFRSVGISVLCLPGSAQLGAGSVCTATVSDASGGVPPSAPLGTVSFFTFDGGSFSGSCQLTPGSGLSSTCGSIYLPDSVGLKTIKATYSGFGSHVSANSGIAGSGFVNAVAASARTTSTSVSCEPGPFAPGTSSTCKATVTDTGGGSPSDPAGTVVFASNRPGSFSSGGACTLGSPTGSSQSCEVEYTPGINSTEEAHAATISAAYGGSGTHAGSSGGSGSVSVSAPSRHATATTVSCTPDSLDPGDPSVCKVTVTDTTGAPTAPAGTVQLWTPGNGEFSSPGSSCTLASPTANAASCKATYTPEGTGTQIRVDTIAATYGGSLKHAASQNAGEPIDVEGPDPGAGGGGEEEGEKEKEGGKKEEKGGGGKEGGGGGGGSGAGGGAGSPSPDVKAPETMITKAPKGKLKTKKRANAKFHFTSTEAGSTFLCKLDRGAFLPCKSPKLYKVKPGNHTFSVKAKDAAGNEDPTPATKKFKVTRKR